MMMGGQATIVPMQGGVHAPMQGAVPVMVMPTVMPMVVQGQAAIMAPQAPQSQVMTGREGRDDRPFEAIGAHIPFEYKHYDVTDECAKGQALCMGPCFICLFGVGCCLIAEGLIKKDSLGIGDQTIVLKQRTACGTKTIRKPYAELGEVEVIQLPSCCYTMSLLRVEVPSLASTDKDGNPVPGRLTFNPGCLDNDREVQAIYTDLENRRAQRGLAAQSVKLDTLLRKVMYLRQDLAGIAQSSSLAGGAYNEKVGMQKLTDMVNIKPPQDQVFNVAPCGSELCCAYSNLHLTEEKMTIEEGNCCGSADASLSTPT